MEVQDSNNTTDAVTMNGKNKNNEQAKQVEVEVVVGGKNHLLPALLLKY